MVRINIKQFRNNLISKGIQAKNAVGAGGCNARDTPIMVHDSHLHNKFRCYHQLYLFLNIIRHGNVNNYFASQKY